MAAADTVLKVNMYHIAIFHANRSSRCRDMAVFRFFNMAAVRHLGFVKVRNCQLMTVVGHQFITLTVDICVQRGRREAPRRAGLSAAEVIRSKIGTL